MEDALGGERKMKKTGPKEVTVSLRFRLCTSPLVSGLVSLSHSSHGYGQR